MTNTNKDTNYKQPHKFEDSGDIHDTGYPQCKCGRGLEHETHSFTKWPVEGVSKEKRPTGDVSGWKEDFRKKFVFDDDDSDDFGNRWDCSYIKEEVYPQLILDFIESTIIPQVRTETAEKIVSEAWRCRVLIDDRAMVSHGDLRSVANEVN